MKISRECIHCLARQAVEIAEEATNIKDDQHEIIRCSLRELSEMDFNDSAPIVAHKMHQHAKRVTGIIDPYKDLKTVYNNIANDISARIKSEKWLENSEDSFDTACRLAIAGNIIDFSVGIDLEYSDILASVEKSMNAQLFGAGSKALKDAVSKANKIMYITDNAGEIIFDKFLIEQMPYEKITLAVKGGPIVNDATRDDAIESGLSSIIRVIDNGFDAQGTPMDYCSKEFIDEFNSSDLIISKGQANFETLSHIVDKEIFYLLRAKCKSVAEEVGCNKMDYVLMSNRAIDN